MPRKALQVSDEMLKHICGLRDEGYTSRDISQKTGVPKETVRKLLLHAGYPSRVPGRYTLTTYDHLDPWWVAEFRGFFLGEGCCTLRYITNLGYPTYMPAIAISVRADDKRVIQDIYETLGGTYVSKMHNGSGERSKPGVGWALTGWTRLANLLPMLLAGMLPAKKRRDIEILLEACQKRFTWPYQMSKEQIAELHRYYLALRDIKRFQGSDG